MAEHRNGAVRVGTLAQLKEKACVVVTGDHGPIAVFYDDGKVHAVDNRCPHMGFPLHRGTVQDGVLTCHWHHAQFDLASGCTFNLFADDVPIYPVEVRDSEVWLTPHRPRGDEAAHWQQRLVEGMEQNIGLVIAKSVIGLLHAGVPYGDIVRIGVLFGTRNRAAGWASGLTILAAMANVCRHLPTDEQMLPLYQGLLHVARDCAGQPPRRDLQPLGSRDLPAATLRRWFRRFVEVRDAEGAERCLLTLLASGADAATVSEVMLAAATDHIYLDGGHTIDFINKAFEVLALIGWEHAANALPSLVGGLCRAGRREESQSWRCPVDLVALLQEASTGRKAHVEAMMVTAPASLLPTLLGESPHDIVAALNEALESSVPPVDLARAVAGAAALRICRFGTQNEFGDWIAVLHTFTYANALHQSLRRSCSPELVRGIYHGAMSVYLDRYLNVPPARLPGERRDDGTTSAPTSRDPEVWHEQLLDSLNRQQQVEEAASLTHRYLEAGLPPREWYRALAVALLREDAEFHSFQMLEAAIQQCETDGPTIDPHHFLIAAARYLAAHAPTDRARNQTARIAHRLHRGDALYEESESTS